MWNVQKFQVLQEKKKLQLMTKYTEKRYFDNNNYNNDNNYENDNTREYNNNNNNTLWKTGKHGKRENAINSRKTNRNRE